MPENERDRDRYCTPIPIAKRMARTFGGLADLDPCHDQSGLTLAHRNYDIRRGQDGLVLPWRGRVWLNCPYSEPAMWLMRAALHWRYRLAETLAIVNVQSGSRYWHRYVWGQASAICFLETRVAFLYDGVPEKGNRYDQAVIYYGSDVARFRRAWSSLGAVITPPRSILTLEDPPRRIRTAMDGMLHEEPPSLLRVVGPAVLFSIYSQIKHMTVEELVESAMPMLEEFIGGYQLGRDASDEEEEEEETVTFDAPGGFPPNGRDFRPPPSPRKRKPAKAKKKAAAKPKAAAPPPKPEPKAKPTAKRKAPQRAAEGAAPSGTGALDEHVLALLKAKNDWTPSRDIAPLIRGVNANQLRKSLARLVDAKLVVAHGATKSKKYMAS